jgi:hypothetical protein
VELRWDRKTRKIALSQSQYVTQVLECTGMRDCKPVYTPLPHNSKLVPATPEDGPPIPVLTIEGREVSYLTVIGSLMYAMLGTRPDLAFTVGVLSRFSAAPTVAHWEAAKRTLRYLKATKDLELVYDGSDVSLDMDFHGYSDADWSGDPDTSRSTSGYVFIANRGAISWASKRQTMVALSSTESEYIGLSIAGQQLQWLRTFFDEIGKSQASPTDLHCDNQAAIILSRDPQFRARTKHIQRKYHHIRDDLVAKGEAAIRYVPTADMVADILTKALTHEQHWKFVKAMGLQLRSSGSVKN